MNKVIRIKQTITINDITSVKTNNNTSFNLVYDSANSKVIASANLVNEFVKKIIVGTTVGTFEVDYRIAQSLNTFYTIELLVSESDVSIEFKPTTLATSLFNKVPDTRSRITESYSIPSDTSCGTSIYDIYKIPKPTPSEATYSNIFNNASSRPYISWTTYNNPILLAECPDTDRMHYLIASGSQFLVILTYLADGSYIKKEIKCAKISKRLQDCLSSDTTKINPVILKRVTDPNDLTNDLKFEVILGDYLFTFDFSEGTLYGTSASIAPESPSYRAISYLDNVSPTLVSNYGNPDYYQGITESYVVGDDAKEVYSSYLNKMYSSYLDISGINCSLQDSAYDIEGPWKTNKGSQDFLVTKTPHIALGPNPDFDPEYYEILNNSADKQFIEFCNNRRMLVQRYLRDDCKFIGGSYVAIGNNLISLANNVNLHLSPKKLSCIRFSDNYAYTFSFDEDGAYSHIDSFMSFNMITGQIKSILKMPYFGELT